MRKSLGGDIFRGGLMLFLAVVVGLPVLYYAQSHLYVGRFRGMIEHPDHNPQLAQVAKLGMPIITQAVDYFRKNGKAATAHELRVLVNDPRLQPGVEDRFADGIVSSDNIDLWEYTPYPVEGGKIKKGFIVMRRLTHDTAVAYEYDGTQGKWMLAGEGERDIVLDL